MIIIVEPQNFIMLDVNEQLIKLAGKMEIAEKVKAQQDLWLVKLIEMNDKIMNEVQSYKMSLEPLSLPGPSITGIKGSLHKTRSETSSRSHKKQEFQKH